MIVTSCFLQYVAVLGKPSRQPGDTQRHSTSARQTSATGLGILAAVSLHLVWLTIPTEADTPEPTVTPPQPIMVNWIAATAGKTPASATPKAERKPEPKIEKPKLTPRPKAAKPQPVVATHNETASAMTVPSNEPLAENTTVEAPASPAPPATNNARVSNSSTEAEQAPLTLPNLNADYLNNPPPIYPAESRRLGEQGKVLLRVLVNSAGTVEQIALRKSSDYSRLDEAAQDTVKQWRFVPAKRGDQRVTAWVVVPISFSLEG